MLEIGLSSCLKELNDALFAAYKESGIENIEISLKYKEYVELDYEMLNSLSKKHGTKLWSLHLPFDFDIDISNPEFSERTVKINKEIIEKATAIGITKFVIHPSAEPIADEERGARMQCSKKALAELAEFADTHGATVAVENLPRTCLGKNSREMLELLSADKRLLACFDTNHLLAENPVDFIHAIGEKIVTTHISDYDFIDEKHWMPGEGKINWQEILAALSDVNYSGAWLYELGFDAPATIKRPRALLCEDFVKNAKELFSGDTITVLGTPIN